MHEGPMYREANASRAPGHNYCLPLIFCCCWSVASSRAVLTGVAQHKGSRFTLNTIRGVGIRCFPSDAGNAANLACTWLIKATFALLTRGHPCTVAEATCEARRAHRCSSQLRSKLPGNARNARRLSDFWVVFTRRAERARG